MELQTLDPALLFANSDMPTPPWMKRVLLRLPVAREEPFLEDVSKLEILQLKEIGEDMAPGLSKDESDVVQERDRLEALIARCDAALAKLPKAGVINQLLEKDKTSPVPLSKDREDKVYEGAEQTLKEIGTG